MNFLRRHQRFFTFYFLSLLGLLILSWIFSSWHDTIKNDFQNQKVTEQDVLKEIQALKNDVVFLKANRPYFEALVQKGWFQPLVRHDAARLIDELAENYHLNQVDYVIIPIPENEALMSQGIHGNQVHLKFSGVLDSDAFQFIEALSLRLSGHTMPTSLSLSREDTLNAESLNELIFNTRPNFVRGEYFFNWVTSNEMDKNNEKIPSSRELSLAPSDKSYGLN